MQEQGRRRWASGAMLLGSLLLYPMLQLMYVLPQDFHNVLQVAEPSCYLPWHWGFWLELLSCASAAICVAGVCHLTGRQPNFLIS